MNLDHARFAAFLSARLCHDIVSPAATMSLSLEMLDSPGSAEEKEQSERMLREGAHGVTATLQFLRYAFGSMGLQMGTADVHQFKKLTDDYLRFQKPSIEWDLGPSELSFGEARLIMNLIMVCLTATVRGGVIHISVREENGQKTITLTCKGDRLKLKEDVVKALRARSLTMAGARRISSPSSPSSPVTAWAARCMPARWLMAPWSSWPRA